MKKSTAPSRKKDSAGGKIYPSPPAGLIIEGFPTRKVTIELDTDSVIFFKNAAKRSHIPYQRLLRSAIHIYGEDYWNYINKDKRKKAGKAETPFARTNAFKNWLHSLFEE